MNTRPQRVLSKIFYILFSICFLWLMSRIVFGSFYGYREMYLLLCAVCALTLLMLIWRICKKHEAALGKRHKAITCCFLSFMFVLQMTFGALLRYQPVFDVNAIYGGAIEWVETGSFASYYDYFIYFFNNFGGLRFFYWVFKIARTLGWTDYYMAAVTVNALLSLCTMFLTGEVCGKLIGPRGQFMAYAVFLVSLPFYFIAPAFYTDALAMPFPILAYWLYLLTKERDRRRERIALVMLMGLTAAVGILIKPIVAIALIAIVIDAVMTWDWKRAAFIASTVLLLFLVCCTSLYGAIYQHLDRDEAEKNRTPLLHWVMMGLKGNGMYNSEDYGFTRSFDDQEERTEALVERIRERIRAHGWGGMLELLTAKGEICFGDGTYGLSDCLGGTPARDTKLHELLLKDGKYYNVYKHLCTGVLLALYVLMIVSALQEVFYPGSQTLQLLVPRLAVFGLLLFLICWEARWRYFSSFIPLICVSALLGMERFAIMTKAVIQRTSLCWKTVYRRKIK